MAGTKHFTRMDYHVYRGLREIVAPRQTMPKKDWEEIKKSFGNKCAYCGQDATQKNRGIVADHVVPVTKFGEFVKGNIIPACQTCNDSRGNKCWKEFIDTKEGSNGRKKIIEEYLAANPYTAITPETTLTAQELKEYNQLLEQWKTIKTKAQKLYDSRQK